jgi:hypothetical protein
MVAGIVVGIAIAIVVAHDCIVIVQYCDGIA